MKGNTFNKNKKRTEDANKKLSNSLKKVLKKKCEWCLLESKPTNHARFHGDNCKKKPGNENKDFRRTEESILKQKETVKTRKEKGVKIKARDIMECQYCNEKTDSSIYKKFHGENCVFKLVDINMTNLILDLYIKEDKAINKIAEITKIKKRFIKKVLLDNNITIIDKRFSKNK